MPVTAAALKTCFNMAQSCMSEPAAGVALKPRFERRAGKAIWRMVEQPRFRAACDFLQLRAAAGEFDSVLAQWWMDLANADDSRRAEMIEEAGRAPREGEASADAPRKRRRRRRPSGSREGGAGGEAAAE